MDKPTSTIELITPSKAEEYLAANKTNRPLNKKRVEYYAAQMENGEWKFNGQSISFLADGTLGDGQHRLAAIIKSGKEQLMNVVRGIDAKAFATYDVGATRSASDVFSVANIPNYTWVSSTVQRYALIARGQSAMTQGGNRKAVNGLTKAQLLSIYMLNPETFQAAALLGVRSTKEWKSLRQTQVAGIAAYLRIDKGHSWEKISKFFELLDNDEPTDCNSIKEMRKRLRREAAGAIKRSSPKYIYNLIKRTWNDFISGNNNRKVLRWTEETEGELQFN